jgi:hypothetical protein
MDTTTIETAVTDAVATEEFPSTTKTIVITAAATAVALIGSRLVLRRHFKKATESAAAETVVTETIETPVEGEVVNA